VETPELDRIQRLSDQAEASAAAPETKRHQNRRQTLGDIPEHAQLPNVQQVKRHDTVELVGARAHSMHRAELRDERKGAVLLSRKPSAARTWVLGTDNGGGQLRVESSDDVTLDGWDAHQAATDLLVLQEGRETKATLVAHEPVKVALVVLVHHRAKHPRHEPDQAVTGSGLRDARLAGSD